MAYARNTFNDISLKLIGCFIFALDVPNYHPYLTYPTSLSKQRSGRRRCSCNTKKLLENVLKHLANKVLQRTTHSSLYVRHVHAKTSEG